ncbi:hypothetical protein QJS10_CPB18g01848 [Acorus calamus]|uniref:Uncharacterized protein n=1 Tax=Acorus calamus TaxID=4465 RepID=A0AAV9CPB8_ACOCL|nr:hypothetical protein QJS10_CPB18g01848 [Acorus calamus]
MQRSDLGSLCTVVNVVTAILRFPTWMRRAISKSVQIKEGGRGTATAPIERRVKQRTSVTSSLERPWSERRKEGLGEEVGEGVI